ncbi:MAG: VanW family protein [Bacillota bacterium]
MKARFPWKQGLAVFLFVFLVGAGALVGYGAALLLDGRILPGVKVAGIPVGGLSSAKACTVLAREFGPREQKPVVLSYGERFWRTTPSTAGVTLDYRATVLKALAIGRDGGIVARLRARKAIAREGKEVAPVFGLAPARWEGFCRAIEQEVNLSPLNAHVFVDLNGTLHFSPSRKGRALDRDRLRALLEESFFTSGEACFDLPLKEVKPSFSEEEIANWPLDQVLGFYVTKFDPADEQRTHNLRLAAAAIDGVIVDAGREFSFNHFVGPRAPEKGYLEAPVLHQNRLVLGMGGGVCQVSSTLFNAVLLAGLAVRKWANHSQPSTYVPLGRDATVVYDTVDFVFANDGDRPVLIAAEVIGSRLVVAVVGHRETRPKVEIEVEIKERIPFSVEVENDPGLAAGAEAVVQPGREGFKVQLWRKMIWPDQKVVREPVGGVTYYPPVKQIVKRGIGSPRFGARPFLPAAEPKPNPNETGGTEP